MRPGKMRAARLVLVVALVAAAFGGIAVAVETQFRVNDDVSWGFSVDH